jgi:hypothetical protein
MSPSTRIKWLSTRPDSLRKTASISLRALLLNVPQRRQVMRQQKLQRRQVKRQQASVRR